MNHWSDDDFVSSAITEQWRADEAPSDFAANVFAAAREERRARAPGRRAGIVVPFLLAAVLVSFGAAAAWDTWVSTPSTAEVEADEQVSNKDPTRLSFHVRGDGAHAEREAEAKTEESVAVAPVRKVPAAMATPPTVESDDSEEEPKGALHYPRCECGTNGVVCTCVD